jgi:hypothetical protein
MYINLNISTFRTLPTPEDAVFASSIGIIIFIIIVAVFFSLKNFPFCLLRPQLSRYYQMLLLLRFSIDWYLFLIIFIVCAYFLLGFSPNEHHWFVNLQKLLIRGFHLLLDLALTCTVAAAPILSCAFLGARVVLAAAWRARIRVLLVIKGSYQT